MIWSLTRDLTLNGGSPMLCLTLDYVALITRPEDNNIAREYKEHVGLL
jgi:hypothetical protein